MSNAQRRIMCLCKFIDGSTRPSENVWTFILILSRIWNHSKQFYGQTIISMLEIISFWDSILILKSRVLLCINVYFRWYISDFALSILSPEIYTLVYYIHHLHNLSFDWYFNVESKLSKLHCLRGPNGPTLLTFQCWHNLGSEGYHFFLLTPVIILNPNNELNITTLWTF